MWRSENLLHFPSDFWHCVGWNRSIRRLIWDWYPYSNQKCNSEYESVLISVENNIIFVLWSRNSTWSDLHPQFRIVFSLFSEFREDTTTTFYQWDIFIYIQYFDLIADWPWLLHLMRWFILCLSNCCCMIWKIWAGVWRFVRFTIRDHKYMYFGILHFVTPINSSLKIHFSLDHRIKVLYIASIPHPSSLNTNLHTCIYVLGLFRDPGQRCLYLRCHLNF